MEKSEEAEHEAKERVAQFFSDTEERDGFLHRIENIAEYSFRISIPPVKIPLDGPRADKMINALYDRVTQINRSAGFYFPQHLEAVRVDSGEEQGIGLKYGDDEYMFSLLLSDGMVAIVRPGSRLRSFVEWYSRFMPSGRQLVETAFQTIMDDSGVEIQATSAVHGFRFLLYQLKSAGQDTADDIRNWQVLERMINHFPAENGEVSTSDEGHPEGGSGLNVEGEGTHVGRVDFDLCRWITGPRDQHLQCWYGVEAPANKLWSTLWISCRLQGQSYKSPRGGLRVDFDSGRFLSDYEFPLSEFLKRRVINGFMYSLLNDVTFLSTSGTIP